MKKLILIAILISIDLFAQNTVLRFPAISPDGKEILFSYQGDIWKAPAEGGEAIRLTVNEANDVRPRWSQNGKQIAFSSNRYGNYDIFTMDISGRNVKRITFRSSDDLINDFRKNRLLFVTSRDFRQVEWAYEIHAVSQEGGTPERILDAVGDMPALSPDGRYLAYVSGVCRIERENYRGPANRDIWVFDTGNKKFIRITNFEGNDFMPRWTNDGALYFISSRNGKYNIFRTKINSNKPPRQITDFDDDGVFYFDVNANGETAVIERAGKIYKLNIPAGEVEKLNFTVGNDFRKPNEKFVRASSGVEEFAVSPSGKYSAFVIRGEIFVTRNNNKKTAVNITVSPYRERSPQWLNDSTIVYVSDESGNYEIYAVNPASGKDFLHSLEFPKRKLTETEKDEKELKISPDKEKIAYVEGNGKLVVVRIDKNGELGEKSVLLDGWAMPEGIAWSPDSKWLAYSLVDLDGNDEIYIQDAEGKIDPINVSMHPKGDYEPFWTPDGSKLLFRSERNNGDFDIWFAWLNKNDWLKSKRDWEEDENDKGNGKKSKKEKTKKQKSKPIKIDLDNIHERLVQVTSLNGDELSPVSSADGKTIYFTSKTPTSKGRDLFKINWDGSKIELVTKGGKSPRQLQLSSDYKTIFMNVKGGKIAKLKNGSKLDYISFKAKYKIDFKAERKQIFNEAWRALASGFYDPQFHGRDWKKLREKYEPIALAASTYEDFRYIFNIMLGQIDASHMGLYPPRNGKNEETTGLLGIEIQPVEEGVKIMRVIPGTPADRRESRLYEGEIITAVNGRRLTQNVNFYSCFVNAAEEKVSLQVKNADGEERTVVIRPVSSVGEQLYREWVERERALVEKFSDGKLGYLHIKAMGWNNFEAFDRDLTAAGYGKEGLVIDVRYNGGGWITDYLLTVLNYKQHAYTIPRGATESLENHKAFRAHYPFGERLPYSAWTKKSVALCNSRSYSNAEIFSHAYKTLDIGTLVGEATFGAVISTGGVDLIDGSYVRLPFRAWYVLKTDENMEHGPAVPDVEIENPQNWKIGENDYQLKKAVEILLKQEK